MTKGEMTGFFHSLLDVVRPHFSVKRVVRFPLILGATLYIDYLLPILPICQPLGTLYELLFCPLLLMIYIEEDGVSFWAHIWSLHSLFVAVVAAALFTVLELMEYKFRN